MTYKLVALAISCLPAVGIAQEIHIVHCLNGGCPMGAPATNDLVIREIYALSNNRCTKFADWVAYRVTRETIGTSNSLERDWKHDDLLLAEETMEKDDYRGAKDTIRTDRGHQAPLAAFAGTHFWRVTNILSNITPQKSKLNQGPWKRLEEAVREAAYKLGEVYVVTGPLFDPEENQMELPNADEPHSVPTGYFKVIADKKDKRLAFIFDQDAKKSMNYCEGVVSLAKVEERSGLNIFPRAKTWSGDLLSQLGCSTMDHE